MVTGGLCCWLQALALEPLLIAGHELRISTVFYRTQLSNKQPGQWILSTTVAMEILPSRFRLPSATKLLIAAICLASAYSYGT
jgi:hypothetical protein